MAYQRFPEVPAGLATMAMIRHNFEGYPEWILQELTHETLIGGRDFALFKFTNWQTGFGFHAAFREEEELAGKPLYQCIGASAIDKEHNAAAYKRLLAERRFP